jgi:DNA-binding response OmpR family regulator
VFPLEGPADLREGREIPAGEAPQKGPRVLLSTDGRELQSIIRGILSPVEYQLRVTQEGDEAWRKIRDWLPQVAVLDVGLPGTPAFEICDRVREHERHRSMGIILLASVYQRTRYKRAPTSLYGADDYIEKHHLRDMLEGKIEKLLQTANTVPTAEREQVPPPPVVTAPAQGIMEVDRRPEGKEDQRTLIREEKYGLQKGVTPGAERLRESLKRYARIIVSDIVLYNEELVAKGVREGSLFAELKKELEEGRQLYLKRLPPTAAVEERDYYRQAVQDFIEKRKSSHSEKGISTERRK